MPADIEGIRLLAEVVDRLLAPDGCPWDRAQTLSSLRTYLLEEAYELLDAMERDPQHHREEVGDMLFQLAFQSAIREREGSFSLGEAAGDAARKLIRRHPHVFGGEAAGLPVPAAGGLQEMPRREAGNTGRVGQGERNWESLKKREKNRASLMDDIPETLPALMQAEKTQRRAASVGFDWPDIAGAKAKIREELAEWEEALLAGDAQKIEEELGDLLFAVVNAARHAAVVPELALRRATRKFRDRFRAMEEAASSRGISLHDLSLDELEELWQAAKRGPG